MKVNQSNVVYIKRLLIFYIAVLLPLQSAFSLGKIEGLKHRAMHAALAIESRLGLDLDKLRLIESVAGASSRTPAIEEYLQSLNNHLEANSWPVRVTDLTANLDSLNDYAPFLLRQVKAADGSVYIAFSKEPDWFAQYLSPFPFISAFLVLLLFASVLNPASAQQGSIDTDGLSETGLTIDLNNKLLCHPITGKKVVLPNKPLCFYCALLEFSHAHPGVSLNPNQPLPVEVLNIANKYFFRLIDLGHTIRKRPNFNSNLEKVLSEIRAALDELFVNDPIRKSRYYPPKAIGEGSRSKLHNVTLVNLKAADIEIIGR